MAPTCTLAPMAIESTKKADKQEARNTQTSDRRELILRALNTCIRKKGYTKTSLTDIAVTAGMSPSHIRYYFEGKDAILEYFLRETCAEIISQIRAIETDDPDKWFADFSNFFISNPRITSDRISVLVEIFGISVHDPTLRKIKSAYDDEIRAILKDYFAKYGCAEGLTPDIAAEMAQALEAGLKYNAVFQKGYEAKRAKRVFRAAMERLSGRTFG